jgi:hypothetical protein
METEPRPLAAQGAALAPTFIGARIDGAGNLRSNPTGGVSSVQKVDTGTYLIKFSTPFANPPVVVVTQEYPGGAGTGAGGGDTRDNAVVIAAHENMIKIKTGKDDGAASDRWFAFIAMG